MAKCICPKCKSDRVVPIIYGYPGPELWEEEERGNIKLGGCRGADMLGERFANENGFNIERYVADWQKYGKSAGPKRNLQMAKACDYVICFWDGKSRGTASMIYYAKKLKKPLKVKMI